MYKNGYAIERILRCKLDKDDFDHLLFWSGSICHLDSDKPEFKHFIIGQQWLYTMNHPQRQLDNVIHFNSILGIECIGDLAMFLTCQITRNYNHICIEFVSKLNQQHRKGGKSVKKTKQKVKFTDKIETKEKECPIKDDVNIDQQDEILSSKVTENYHDPTMTIIRKLHIYLTDTNFIGFDILQKAINRWYQSNNEFKYMVTKLIHLTDFQHPLTSNKQSISSLSSSPPPSGDNIETLIAKATRRNTIVYSTTAENEDLQQLMNMFKPFFKSDTIISTDTNNTQIDHHILTLNDYLNKFDHWINKTKMINESINKRRTKFNYIHLINEQLIQLDNHLRVVFENYPLYTCKGLPNKVITVMELLVTQITYTLPAQPIFLGNKETQIFVELENHDKPTTGAQSKQTRSDRMKLVIHLMKIINLLLSYILTIFTQSNRNLNLLNKDQIKITVDEIIIKKKLEGVIQRLIEQLIQLPCVINDFSLNEFNKQSVQQSNCFQIELEAWIRRYEMEKLDIMSKKFICVNQWQQEVFNKDLHTVTTSTLRSIFKSHIEIGIFIHQLNYQISYFFTELISNTSSILNRTTNNNTRTIHQEEDWIKQIIHRIIIKSKKSILYLLDCFLSHSYTTFSIIHSKVRNYSLTTTTTPTPTTMTTAAAVYSVLISTSNIEQKQEQSIATIIRSLFIIDWLTSQYPYLIQLLIKELGYNDLIHIYNTQCIISLIDQLNKRSTFNLIQIKLIKCILIALINRLNEKFNITNDIS